MPKSLKGHFLVSGCRLRDPNFFKSVVLIVEHGPTGAMGLVVNSPDSTTLSETLNGCIEFPENGDVVFVGGPVEPAALFIVHNAAHLDPGESEVVPNVFMGGSSEVFEQVIEASLKGETGLKYRVFKGCSGWGPRQLEGELDRGDWLIVPATESIVFHENPYAVWEELLSALRAASGLADPDCSHPEWN